MNKYQDQVTTLIKTLQMRHNIPKFQRNYDWRIEHCDELINDIILFSKNKNQSSKYSFGQIVCYVNNNDELYIVDGQQRITTANLFAMAIYHICNKINNLKKDDTAASLREKSTRMIRDDDYNFNLNVYQSNIDAFDKLSKNDILFSPETPAQTNMRNNYIFFYERICDILGIQKNENGDYVDSEFERNDLKLDDLKNYFNDFSNFTVCTIYCINLVDAYKMFESINHRGISLTDLDLLKCHIYSKCYTTESSLKDDDFSIEKKWNAMCKMLPDKEDDKIQYLMYFTRATRHFVREKQVYNALIDSIKNEEDSLKFIKEFTESLEFFKLAKDHEYCTEEIKKETKNVLNGFDSLNFTTYMPMALSVYLKNKGSKKLPGKIEAILRPYDYFLILCIKSEVDKSGTIEIPTSNNAVSYYKNEKTLSECINHLYSLNKSTDDEILTGLMSHNWAMAGNNSEARYVLSELYNRRDYAPTKVDLDKVHLEHILPQSPKNLKKNWPKITIEEHTMLYPKLGNLCLLVGPKNQAGKDYSYEKKKEILKIEPKPYADINDSLIWDIEGEVWFEEEGWGRTAIEERTLFLAESIMESWKKTPYEEDE